PKDEVEDEDKRSQTPVKVGVPVKVSENRGQMAIEIDGKPYVAVFAFDKVGSQERVSLLIIDTKTGVAEQYWYPQKGSANGTMFHMLRGSNDCIYTTIGHEVLEFDLLKRRWTANKPIDGIAMSFTESPDGKIYFGTYPKSTLWEFDPKTKQARLLGNLDPQQQYPHYMEVDDFGWLYAGIGTAKGNLVAFNLQTNTRVQLSEESTRQVGYAQVFRGTDGKVYGFEPKAPNQIYRLENGVASPLSGTIAKAPQNNTHFNTFSVNQYLSGGRIVSCDMSEKLLETIDKDNKVTKVRFDYESNGPAISSLVIGTDGYIYGSTNHPMHFFKYEPDTDKFTDYTNIQAVGGGNFPNLVAWKGQVVGATYPNGRAYLFDPSLPWTKGTGANPNPKLIGTYQDIYRPRTILLLKDNKSVAMGGYAGYGRTGGGMVFYNLENNQSTVLTTEDILVGHSTVSLRQLKNGNLIGGTSTAAPGGGDRLAFVSVLYEMDLVSKEIISQVNIGQDIFNLEVTSDDTVIGLTNDARIFVYNPIQKKVVYMAGVSGGAVLNAGQSLIKDKDDNVYLILSKSISKVSKDGKVTKLVNLPEDATSGIGIVNNEIFYASAGTLWKYSL